MTVTVTTAPPARPYRCHHPDVMAETDAPCAWPAGVPVTWYFDPSITPAGGVAAYLIEAAIVNGISAWSFACGVTIQRVTDPVLARVIVAFQPIDGPGNVVGLTDLPCGAPATAVMRLRLDSAENWTPGMIQQVVTHEFGHALGLVHAPAGTLAIMDPYYNPSIFGLQAWDKDQAALRYGPPPKTPSTPLPTSDPSDSAPATPTDPNAIVLQFQAPVAGTYLITLSIARRDPCTLPHS